MDTVTTIKKDSDFSVRKFTELAGQKKGEEMGKEFPWVLTINANTDDAYTMCFRNLDDAAEAAKSWHGNK